MGHLDGAVCRPSLILLQCSKLRGNMYVEAGNVRSIYDLALSVGT